MRANTLSDKWKPNSNIAITRPDVLNVIYSLICKRSWLQNIFINIFGSVLATYPCILGFRYPTCFHFQISDHVLALTSCFHKSCSVLAFRYTVWDMSANIWQTSENLYNIGPYIFIDVWIETCNFITSELSTKSKSELYI